MVIMRIIGFVAILAGLASSVTAVEAKIVAVPAADRVVANLGGLPVSLGLAQVDIPVAVADQARKELASLVEGKSVRIDYESGWGTDPQGNGRVHLRAGTIDVLVKLVEAGLAQVTAEVKEGSPRDRLLLASQERAKKAKKGIWAMGAATVVASTRPETPVPRPAQRPAAPASATTAPTPAGAFASELNNKYFYPADHRALANVPSQRLIYYSDEASAKRAGKSPPPTEIAVPQGAASIAGADSAFGEGEKVYADAIAAGNTSKRDELYSVAFQKLTVAMNLYGELVEKNENDAALAEKLRRCMQLRYGAMKQKRSY